MSQKGSRFIEPANEDSTAIEKWAYYNQVKKEAEAKLKELSFEALALAERSGDFYNSSYGGVQRIKTSKVSARDSLKFYLQDKGVYEVCREDKIDLKKVNELIDAGILGDDVLSHIETKNDSYLKLKK